MAQIAGDYDVGQDEPSNKRQRLDYTETISGNQAFAHGVPVVIADEASVAALQAMDGSLADIQHHMAESGHVTGHIAIPVAIASDAAIQVQGDLEHAVTLSQGVQQLSSTLVDSSGHELDMSSVQVVSAPQTVVVTSLEAVTGTGQPSETVVVTSLDGVTTTARRTHDGFTIVTVPSQGGGLAIGEQEKVQGGDGEDEIQNNGHETSEDDSGNSRFRLKVRLCLPSGYPQAYLRPAVGVPDCVRGEGGGQCAQGYTLYTLWSKD